MKYSIKLGRGSYIQSLALGVVCFVVGIIILPFLILASALLLVLCPLLLGFLGFLILVRSK